MRAIGCLLCLGGESYPCANEVSISTQHRGYPSENILSAARQEKDKKLHGAAAQVIVQAPNGGCRNQSMIEGEGIEEEMRLLVVVIAIVLLPSALSFLCEDRCGMRKKGSWNNSDCLG